MGWWDLSGKWETAGKTWRSLGTAEWVGPFQGQHFTALGLLAIARWFKFTIMNDFHDKVGMLRRFIPASSHTPGVKSQRLHNPGPDIKCQSSPLRHAHRQEEIREAILQFRKRWRGPGYDYPTSWYKVNPLPGKIHTDYLFRNLLKCFARW